MQQMYMPFETFENLNVQKHSNILLF